MKKTLTVALITLLASPSLLAADYGSYKGSGGMSAHKIKANVYEYHYDKGFTGADAMGWDPNLQFAWSRVAAASACGVAVDKAKAMDALQAQYQQDPMIQEIVGIGFHEAQVKANPRFCCETRVAALRQLVPSLEDGSFEKPFN